MTERLEAIVSGKVQMVMFRDFVQRKASVLKITGEVRNIKDGTVLVVAEGDHETLEKLLARLHHGPLLARVDSVSASWLLATQEYKSFKISYAK
jgi:acylphosphatase